MGEHFGEKLKAHYANHIEQARTSREASFSAAYLRHAYHGNFEGLTPEEIEQIRVAQTVETLPKLYVEFLQTMGRKAGGIFVGCDMHFEALLVLKSALVQMMDENRYDGLAIPMLPTNAFVFLAIQGVDFFFFEAAPDQDDPPVYYYLDGIQEYHQVAPTLSSWLWEEAFDPTKAVQKFLPGSDFDKTER